MGDKKNAPTKVAFLFGAGAETDTETELNRNYGICSGYEYITRAFPDQNAFKAQGNGLSAKFKEKNGEKKTSFNGRWEYRKDRLSLSGKSSDAKSDGNDTGGSYSGLVVKIAKRLVEQAISDNGAENYANRYKVILQKFFTEKEAEELGLCQKPNSDNTDNSGWKHNSKMACRDYNELCSIIAGKEKKYSEIESPFVKEILGAENNDTDKTVKINYTRGTAGILDEYFHTIIDPQRLGSVKFAKVFNYYWACYFTILKDVVNWLYSKNDKVVVEKVEKYLHFSDNSNGTKAENGAKAELNYQIVLEDLHNLTKTLYGNKAMPLRQEGSYYDLIAQQLEDTSELACVGVATTNYYRFCETVSRTVCKNCEKKPQDRKTCKIENCEKNAAPIYLNGSLNLFEFPETLEVLDAMDDSDSVDLSGKKLFFPFIFGQSMVKPVVHSKQTEAFHRFKKMLDEADVLVVLGYGINEDDNHINAFLHEFLTQKEKHLICVSEKKKPDIMQKLRFPDEENKKIGSRITCITYEGGNQKTVEAVFEKINPSQESAAVAAGSMASEKEKST